MADALFRRFPSRTTILAVAAGGALFWAPALLLRLRLEKGEKFLAAIPVLTVLVPLALLAVWRAWFDAPTRAERLALWVKLGLIGPYVGAVLVGAATFFSAGEYDAWQSNPETPAVSGVFLPFALLTVRAGLAMLHNSLFLAFPVLVVITLLIPKGAHRPVG